MSDSVWPLHIKLYTAGYQQQSVYVFCPFSITEISIKNPKLFLLFTLSLKEAFLNPEAPHLYKKARVIYIPRDV